MRVPDRNLAEVWDRGLHHRRELPRCARRWRRLRKRCGKSIPKPEDYFTAPEEHPELAAGNSRGLRLFPYISWALNRLPVYPDLIDGAERLLGTQDLEIYKIELWAKYSGAVNYDQFHHRDFGNHSLVVPRADRNHTQMTTFMLLSDVTAEDAPTKLVPLKFTARSAALDARGAFRRSVRARGRGYGSRGQPADLQD